MEPINTLDRQWAIGLTQEEYELLIMRLWSEWTREEDELRERLFRCYGDAVKHKVFEPFVSGKEPKA